MVRAWDSLPLRAKMLGAFAAVALFTLVLGGTASFSLSRLNDNQRLLYADVFAGNDLLGQYNDITWESRTLLLSYLIEDSALNRSWIRERILDDDTIATDLLQQMFNADSDGSERQSLEKLYASFRDYGKWRDSVVFPLVDAGARETALLAYQRDGARLSESIDSAADEARTARQRAAAAFYRAAEETYDRIRLLSVSLAIGAAALALAIGWLMSGFLTKNLRRMAEAAQEIATGDLSQALPATSTNDEIGQLGRSFRAMMVYLRRLADASNAIAHGDLSREVQVESPNDVLGMAFNKMTNRLEAASRQIATEQQALREREERFRALVQNASELSAIVDADGVIQFHSASVQGILGYAAERSVGSVFYTLVHEDDRAKLRGLFAELSAAPGKEATIEVRFLHRDGRWLTFESICSNLLHHPAVRGIVINSRDISERKQLEDQLVHQALHDPLTGLPNRALFTDRLNQAITRAARHDRDIAVLFLDLDGFKVVNDSLGHKAGDALLVDVGTRLTRNMRTGDTAARLGGDEFTLLLEDVADVTEATFIADRILQSMQAPFSIDGHEVFVSCSIGVTMSQGPGLTPSDLLREADTAMYEAKRRGKACFEVFTSQMNVRAWRRLELESDLRHAVDRGDFRLVYQPIIHLASGQMTEVEALLRWDHPRHGVISPLEFIPLAEETGLIIPLGRWVIEEACRTVRQWEREIPGDALTIAVNLSARQFQHPALVEDIAGILRMTGLKPNRLKLEITESVMMQEGEQTIQTLQQLKGLGIQLAIDDFGTGYSSLAYLKRFPIDALKIDQSFVNGLGSDGEDQAIVRTILSLAQSLNLAVVGEGIETPEQLDYLRTLGCDLGQGYHFSRPVAADVLLSMLAIPGAA